MGGKGGGGQTSSGSGAKVISHDILLHELIQLGGGAGHREGGRLLQKHAPVEVFTHVHVHIHVHTKLMST